jgi:hypothetical protein
MTKSFRSTDARSWRCEGCNGMIRVPRKQTPDAVRAHHAETCPARRK